MYVFATELMMNPRGNGNGDALGTVLFFKKGNDRCKITLPCAKTFRPMEVVLYFYANIALFSSKICTLCGIVKADLIRDATGNSSDSLNIS